MADIWLVVFREFIEISIIMGIIFAGISFVKNVHIYFIISFFISLFLAYIFSFFVNSIADSFDGLGEELFNCVILSVTVFFILFTIIIMKDQARKLKQETKEFASNKQELINISLKKSIGIVSLITSSILKEFIEIVMFIKSISLTNKYSFCSI
jgi:high-affinity iron transporter